MLVPKQLYKKVYAGIPSLRIFAAFTLIELLVSVAIIGILIAVVIPFLGYSRKAAEGVHCASNLRQLHAAAMLWIHDHNGKMPDARAWSYNEAATSFAYDAQLSPYLSINAPKSTNWKVFQSPMKCNVADQHSPSTSIFGRTYSINAYATATIADGSGLNPRSELNGYATNIALIEFPSHMALFFDGAAAAGGGAYASSINASHVSSAGTTPIQYVHDDSINVIFLDGHVRKIGRQEMERDYASSDSRFWRFDKQ